MDIATLAGASAAAVIFTAWNNVRDFVRGLRRDDEDAAAIFDGQTVYRIETVETVRRVYEVRADSADEAIRVYEAADSECILIEDDILTVERNGEPRIAFTAL